MPTHFIHHVNHRTAKAKSFANFKVCGPTLSSIPDQQPSAEHIAEISILATPIATPMIGLSAGPKNAAKAKPAATFKARQALHCFEIVHDCA